MRLAHTNRRTEATPHATQTIAYRSLSKLCGFPRHAAYAIAMAITGPTTKRVSSCSAPVSHRYSGLMGKDYRNGMNDGISLLLTRLHHQLCPRQGWPRGCWHGDIATTTAFATAHLGVCLQRESSHCDQRVPAVGPYQCFWS